MARTGTQPKFKVSTLKQQRENAQLELIIEKFGHAMRRANRKYIVLPVGCSHDNGPRFTLGMEMVWSEYVDFCMSHPNE